MRSHYLAQSNIVNLHASRCASMPDLIHAEMSECPSRRLEDGFGCHDSDVLYTGLVAERFALTRLRPFSIIILPGHNDERAKYQGNTENAPTQTAEPHDECTCISPWPPPNPSKYVCRRTLLILTRATQPIPNTMPNVE